MRLWVVDSSLAWQIQGIFPPACQSAVGFFACSEESRILSTRVPVGAPVQHGLFEQFLAFVASFTVMEQTLKTAFLV